MPEPQQLSTEEISRMRDILAQHDKAHANRFMDLNNPPREPYVFQKFPMLLYSHKESKPPRAEQKRDPYNPNGPVELIHHPAMLATRTVNNEGELKQWLEKGWSKAPPVFDAPLEKAG
jgi:hypothetical protein